MSQYLYMNVGEAIKDLRCRKKLSQKDLAKRLGITQGYLSLIERGEREPNLDFIKKTGECLGIPQQLIFLLTCDPRPKHKSFAKPIKEIAAAIDDILQAI